MTIFAPLKRQDGHERGFATFELFLALLALVILAASIYTFIGKGQTEQPLTETSRYSEDSSSTEKTETQPTSTPLPTLAPLETTTSDAVINQTSQDLNSLDKELNDLDKIETSLELPSLDFSTGF